MKQDKSNLDHLQSTIGYNFKSHELLEQALTHKSYAVECSGNVKDNERLEFLGDAVLELVVSHLLYERFASKCSEGELTRMRAYLVNESQLAKQASRIGLGDCIRLGRGERRSGGAKKPSILSDSFEALLGAMYLDGGIEPIFTLITRYFKDIIDEAYGTGQVQDYKTILQEITQARFHTVPEYVLEKVSGPDHQRKFKVALYLRGKLMAKGEGKSKKEAEREAASKALQTFIE